MVAIGFSQVGLAILDNYRIKVLAAETDNTQS